MPGVLTLGEGDTPVVRLLGANLPGCNIFLKREDLNPTGSHKDRALCHQVATAKRLGQQRLIISSSGNAAISAAAYCARARIRLVAFVSPNIDSGKLARLRAFEPRIIVSGRAISLAMRASSMSGVRNMRPSTDDESVEGFASLGLEIARMDPVPDAVFTFATSGSSAIGIAKALIDELPSTGVPRLHVVHAGSLGGDADSTGLSTLCGVDVGLSRRAREVRQLAKQTRGGVHGVSDSEVRIADELLRRQGILAAYESCAAVAVSLREVAGSDEENVLCVITGSRHLASGSVLTSEDPMLHRVEEDEELDLLLEEIWRDER